MLQVKLDLRVTLDLQDLRAQLVLQAPLALLEQPVKLAPQAIQALLVQMV